MSKWEYLAGLVDADGCIGGYISSVKLSCGISRTLVQFTITSSRHKLVKWLKNDIGGNVYPAKKDENGDILYWQWEIQEKNLLRHVLGKIIPYLKIKREQGKTAIEFLKLLSRGGRISKRRAKKRVKLIKKIQELNQKGMN